MPIRSDRINDLLSTAMSLPTVCNMKRWGKPLDVHRESWSSIYFYWKYISLYWKPGLPSLSDFCIEKNELAMVSVYWIFPVLISLFAIVHVALYLNSMNRAPLLLTVMREFFRKKKKKNISNRMAHAVWLTYLHRFKISLVSRQGSMVE